MVFSDTNKRKEIKMTPTFSLISWCDRRKRESKGTYAEDGRNQREREREREREKHKTMMKR